VQRRCTPREIPPSASLRLPSAQGRRSTKTAPFGMTPSNSHATKIHDAPEFTLALKGRGFKPAVALLGGAALPALR
jgi:hypothetical protein